MAYFFEPVKFSELISPLDVQLKLDYLTFSTDFYESILKILSFIDSWFFFPLFLLLCLAWVCICYISLHNKPSFPRKYIFFYFQQKLLLPVCVSKFVRNPSVLLAIFFLYYYSFMFLQYRRGLMPSFYPIHSVVYTNIANVQLICVKWFLVYLKINSISLSYLPKDQSLKFLQKKLRIGGVENLSFIKLAIFYFIPIQISHNLWGTKNGT